ncbi:MAG: transposase [Verrucomicrobia bacterium]|nr:transposase [Verrucomicrobiota bacterium]
MSGAIQTESAWAYHVIARCEYGDLVFREDPDYTCFLQLLGEACRRSGWRIHAYVLMPSHCHLLVETTAADLVAGMGWLQRSYVLYHYHRHHRDGRLFREDCKMMPVEGAEGIYCHMVSTYIHLNPARAKLVRISQQGLRGYRWSSYPSYVNRVGPAPAWLCTQRVLSSLGLGPADMRQYEAYIEGRARQLGVE